MKNNKNNNCNFPTLRFPEFTGEWKEVRIADILTIGSGKDYKGLSGGNIPVYGTGGYMTAVNDYLYDGESVCIGRKGTINKPMFLTGKFWTVDTLFFTHSFRGTIPQFSFYLFENINWLQYNEASGVPSLSKATIESIQTKIPSIIEQEKIASFLSLIDERIATQNKIIAHLESLIKGLSQIIFENNAGWKESTISEVASVVSGGTPDTSIPSFWGGEINWFTPSEIGRAKYVNSSDRTITEKGLKNSSAKLLPPNSLLLSTRATIGECSICQSTCTTNQGFQSLVAILVDYEFLYYLIRTKKSELIKKACGSTFPEISANEVKQLKILVPTINIQKQIANLLMSVDEKITTETKILSAYNLQKQTLLQRLFI